MPSRAPHACPFNPSCVHSEPGAPPCAPTTSPWSPLPTNTINLHHALLLDPDPVHAGRRLVAGVERDEQVAVRQQHTARVAEAPGHHVLPEILELAWPGCARLPFQLALVEDELLVPAPGWPKSSLTTSRQRGGSWRWT